MNKKRGIVVIIEVMKNEEVGHVVGIEPIPDSVTVSDRFFLISVPISYIQGLPKRRYKNNRGKKDTILN